MVKLDKSKKKIENNVNNIINFIKKYSVHFTVLIPFTVLLLNFSNASVNILKLPTLLFDSILNLFSLIAKLKVLHIITCGIIIYYLIQCLDNFAKNIKKDKKLKKKIKR